MQESDNVFEKNRRVLYRFQKSLQLQSSSIKIMLVACKFREKIERSEFFEIHAKSIANQQKVD